MKTFQILVLAIFLSAFNIGTSAIASVVTQGEEAVTTTQQMNGKHNINTATMEELIQIPGIGPKTAGKIIEYRTLHGNFKELNELLEVKGIGNKKLDMIKEYVTL